MDTIHYIFRQHIELAFWQALATRVLVLADTLADLFLASLVGDRSVDIVRFCILTYCAYDCVSYEGVVVL